MILKSQDRTPAYAEHAQGGDGRIERDVLLSGDQLGGACSFVAQISLEPGCSIGVHQHVGDNELYFITEGTGLYNEEGTEHEVSAGDVTFCPEGGTHGIANNGTEMLRFVAVIQKA